MNVTIALSTIYQVGSGEVSEMNQLAVYRAEQGHEGLPSSGFRRARDTTAGSRAQTGVREACGREALPAVLGRRQGVGGVRVRVLGELITHNIPFAGPYTSPMLAQLQ